MASGYPQGRDRRGHTHTAMGRCRDCGDVMVWATTPFGARIPLNVEVHTDLPPRRPFLLIEREREWRVAVELKATDLAGEALELGLGLRSCHFDTCPQRRPRERADLA